MALSVDMIGGLGNQLFCLAACETFAKQTNRRMFLDPNQPQTSPHSNHKYFERIFKKWKSMFSDEYEVKDFSEPPNLAYINWQYILNQHPNKKIALRGYFQNWKYVEPCLKDFSERLCFDETLKDKYDWIKDYFFIHVRGGDYLNQHKSLHYVDLRDYYKKCLESIPGEKIVLFTNDVPYAEDILKNNSYILIEEDEENTLFLMSICKGGICANSTFSWWGAYLNPNRKLFIPSKWFNTQEINVEGYFFPGATIVNVES